jgi:sugar phosphate isomerase/epimerase
VAGSLSHHDPEVRARALDAVAKLLSAAGELGAVGVVVVGAESGDASNCRLEEARCARADALSMLSEIAVRAGATLLLEPLAGDMAGVPASVAEAVRLLRDTAAPGLGLALDFYHTAQEAGGTAAAILTARDYIKHVYVRRAGRTFMAEAEAGSEVLAAIGYRGFITQQPVPF